jgi:filamentous hemagglutinin
VVRSTKAFQNYAPGGATEFVFDSQTSRFVVGTPRVAGIGSPHQQLAAAIDANGSSVVGGMFRRGSNGEILTNEFSGHYW